jgi:hypothetical protein
MMKLGLVIYSHDSESVRNAFRFSKSQQYWNGGLS